MMGGAAPAKKTEADEYAKKGTAYVAAYESMQEWIKAPFRPPSLEVFEQEIKDASKPWKSISPSEMASRLIREAEEKQKSG